jgi:outer membrane protein assembly factor BamB
MSIHDCVNPAIPWLRVPLKIAGRCVILTLLLSSTAGAQTSHSSWPKFQNGGSPAASVGALATTWTPDQNVAWKAAIEGYGQSTPVVFDGQIYVTSMSGDQREHYHLTAFSLTTGEKIWQRDFENPTRKDNTPMTSRAAPSAIADSTVCIAFFEGGIVVSVDRQGAVRWERNLIDEYGPADGRHGLAASLEQDGERVFVWVERSEFPYILALDKTNGESVWKVDGVGATSWASPRLVKIGNSEHLICSASGKILGVDPENGHRLWEFTGIANNTSCTPIPAGENRFLMGASDGRGEETSGSGAQFNGVIEVKTDGEGFSASFLWTAEKASSSFGSPVVADGSACFVNRAGVLHRLDLETGKPLAAVRTSAGGIWATPIVTGDHLYLFGYKGTTSVMSLKDDKEIAANRLWEAIPTESSAGSVLYAAAAVPPYFILRSGDTLYAVKETNR